jgi:hypothetical protein
MKLLVHPRERQVSRFELEQSGLTDCCASRLELRHEWVAQRGWTACHTDEGYLHDFGISALVRRCLIAGSNEIQIIRTHDLLETSNTSIRVWTVAATVAAISNALAGYSPHQREGMTLETAHLGYQPLLVTHSIKAPSFLILRDSGTCATIAGPQELVDRFVAQASVDYDFYVGIPRDGLSYGADRQPFDPGMTRSEALRRDREILHQIREARDLAR